MTGVRTRGEEIRHYILEHVEKSPSNISKITADRFKITRQAANKHLQRLAGENALTEMGNTRNRTYKLAPLAEWSNFYETAPGLAEDVVWTRDVRPALVPLPDNVLDIWHYGFTEMFNNAIDHAGGTRIFVRLRKTAAGVEMILSDNGVGIFKKIQTASGLLDERHAVLELAKGKLTTDPRNHTGEGIFFTSRMFDSFDILSGEVFFCHVLGKPEDGILQTDKFESGTTVWMKLHKHSARTTRKIFDQFSGGEDYTFSKTVVPVGLAKYGDDNLISRSQAKRLLARMELFKVVVLDFKDVDTIGQAFADEIFRVFAGRHPHIVLEAVRAHSQIKRMIERARSGAATTGENPGGQDAASAA
jgi:anti-sigma regulatory factor (Ser/Thr protein kinase)